VFVGEKFNLDAQDLRVFEYLIMVFLGTLYRISCRAVFLG